MLDRLWPVVLTLSGFVVACGSPGKSQGASGGGTTSAGRESGGGSSGTASNSSGGDAGAFTSCDDLECVDGRIELASCPGKPFVECDRQTSGVDCVASGPCPDLAGSEGGAGGDPGAELGVDRFCDAWIDAFAEFMRRCACETATLASYRERARALCEASGYLGALPAAVRAGDFTYHADAAARLLARLEGDQAPCVEEPFRALALDSEELYSLGGVFVGTRSLGEVCRHPVGYKGGISDCRRGFCAPDGAGAGVCIAFAGRGSECDASGDSKFQADVPRLCHDVRLADADGEYESAFDALGCVAATTSSVRTCVDRLADGTPCTASEQCESGRCVDVGRADSGDCSPKALEHEPCESHSECASGACTAAEPRVCGAPLPEGAPCEYSDAACASGFCSSALDGVPPFCAPAPTRLPSEPCTSASDCVSDGHGDSRDRVCQDGRCVNDICAAYAD